MGSGEGFTMRKLIVFTVHDIVRGVVYKIEMGRSCSQNGRGYYFQILTGTPTGKRPLGRRRRN